MTYQGHLMDLSGDALGKTAPVNKLIQFDIFAESDGGDSLWGETQTVTVDNGYFSVILGEGDALGEKPQHDDIFIGMDRANKSAAERYIGITVDGGCSQSSIAINDIALCCTERRSNGGEASRQR